MRTLALLLGLVTLGVADQAPDLATIMAKVGTNQTQAELRRRDFVYTQKQVLRMVRSNGKVAREEHREYVVTPHREKTDKKLTHFEGKYQFKNSLVAYDEPNYHYKGMDIDGDLINSMSEDLTNDKKSRDGIGADLFPLSEKQQPRYEFHLKGKEQYRGREVYRVAFEPKPHPKGHLEIDTDTDDCACWKGEALIDAEEFQPVTMFTSLAWKMPTAVKILLGTNITGLGFSVSYQKFDDGVWFPVSYGGEFRVRGLFFYQRTMSVSLVNSDFRKQDVNSKIAYTDNGNQ